MNPRMLFSNKKITAVLGILLVIAIAAGVYFYTKANTDPQKEAQKQVADAVAKVGRIMVLPTGETPTLATVSDPEKLKGQAFFANAKKGDLVLIYTASKKAILYDPAANKIVEVAPVNLGAQ